MKLLQTTKGKIIFAIMDILALVVLGSEIVFGWYVMKSRMLPAKYELIVIAILVVIFIAETFLIIFGHKKICMIIQIVLSILIVTAMVMGTYVVKKGLSTLDNITGMKEQIVTIGVYVRASDDAETLEQTENYVYGITENTDKDNINDTLGKITETIGKKPTVEKYDDVVYLTDALKNIQCDVIVINTAWLPALEDIEEYSDLESDIKMIASYEYTVMVNDTDDGTLNVTKHDNTNVSKDLSGNSPFIMYISGIDNWGHISGVGRSDVNILAIVNPTTRQILLVSTPRDYYVPLSISNGVKDKLTHAGIYGINVSEDTLEMLYGIDIDYYFKLNFSGFEGLIDVLGGITVESEYDFTVEPIKHYTVGSNKLTGLEALAFARERYSFADGDRQRGRNQMAVITAVVNKMASSALIKNYGQIMEETEGTFATDVPTELLASLVRNQLDTGGAWNVVSTSVDGTGEMNTTYSLGSSTRSYVMVPDEESVNRAKQLIKDVLDGKVVTVE